LHAAIAAAFLRWQENEARIVQERPQVWEGITLSTNVTNFIFDHLLPSLMHQKQSGKRLKTHKILELIVALEPDQFIGLVLVYAHRIGDRDGVSRAFDIFMLPSSFYRQHLKAYRDSHAGGLEKAFHAKAGLKKRNQEILKRRNELLAKGKLKRNIAGILGNEFKLTATSIRGILKNTKS